MIAGVIAAVVLVVGVPVVLAVVGWSSFVGEDRTVTAGPEGDEGAPDEETAPDDAPDDAPGGEGDGVPGDGGGPEADAPEDDPSGDGDPVPETLEVPDLDDLDGVDAVYGRLLTDIDASELVMIGFQQEVGTAFSSPGTDPADLIARLQDIAGEHRAQLLDVRERLDDGLDDEGAEAVRERYVVHLDSWADYMEAVEEDPQALAGEGSDAGFNVAINATADAFSRSLEEELPDDVDDDVQRLADGILDRGFRGGGSDAQV